MAITWTLHLARHAPTSGHIDFDGVSQQGQFWSCACPLACIAFMQSLIASSASTLAVAAAPSMLARICISAHAEAIGANVNEKAIRIASMERSRCRAKDPFRC